MRISFAWIVYKMKLGYWLQAKPFEASLLQIVIWAATLQAQKEG